MKNTAAILIALITTLASASAAAQSRTVLVNASTYTLDISVHFGRYVKDETVRPRGRLTLPEGKSYLAIAAVDDRNRRICSRNFHVNGERQITFTVTPDRKCEFQRT